MTDLQPNIPPTADLASKDYVTFFPQGQPVRNGMFLQLMANFSFLETSQLGTWLIDYAIKVEGQDGLTWGHEEIAMTNSGAIQKIVPLTNGVLVYLRYRTKDSAGYGVPFYGAAYILNSDTVANALQLATLFQTTWNEVNPCGYPLSPVQNVAAEQGSLVMLRPTAPAAGANFSYTLRPGCRLRLISASGSLSTSAAVAARTVEVLIASSTGVLKGASVIFPPHAASLQWYYTLTVTQQPIIQAASTYPATYPFERLPDVVMTCDATGLGDILTFNTVNIQAADQWIAPYLTGWAGFSR